LRLSRKYLVFLDLVNKVDPECRQYPDMFFPEDWTFDEGKHQVTQFAKMICKRCPIQEQCLEYAIEGREEFGVWGATTSNQR
jgi:WhiB family transcriptional regulator, redox-sensing transcriptional regulator